MGERPRRGIVAIAVALAAACSAPPPTAPIPNTPRSPATTPAPTPAPPSEPTTWTLDREKVIAALDFWREAAGLTYVLINEDVGPRLLVRPGTDGLAPWGGGRALIDGTAADNRATSGLVVIEPGGGSYCDSPSSELCRYLYRHEIGHALGFSGHSGLLGVMQSGTDQLHPRELAMVRGLYSLPHGAIPIGDSWRVEGTGEHGSLDPAVAADIVNWNMKPTSSYRRSSLVSRWELPVRVYLVNEVVRR